MYAYPVLSRLSGAITASSSLGLRAVTQEASASVGAPQRPDAWVGKTLTEGSKVQRPTSKLCSFNSAASGPGRHRQRADYAAPIISLQICEGTDVSGFFYK